MVRVSKNTYTIYKIMISLREWLENVETNWSPKEGLFTNDDPEYIASY